MEVEVGVNIVKLLESFPVPLHLLGARHLKVGGGCLQLWVLLDVIDEARHVFALARQREEVSDLRDVEVTLVSFGLEVGVDDFPSHRSACGRRREMSALHQWERFNKKIQDRSL